MLYLIDSSAKNLLGHNLEYLERISEATESQSLILGNRELVSVEKSNYRPTFEFGTWDFGRFGFRRNKLKSQGDQDAKTLRSSRTLIITERFIEKAAEATARFVGRLVMFAVGFTKQTRYFYKDLTKGLCDITSSSAILVSTANARELVGLNMWAQNFPIDGFPISVILRRPLLDLRSYFEIPFLYIDALIYISAIRELDNKIRFFADTPSLAAQLSKRASVNIEYIPTLGFEIQQGNPNALVQCAIAPNSRVETRFSTEDLTSIPQLRASAIVSIDSKSYRELLSTTKSILLPYDPLRYRLRSSGIFAEALTLGILPIVPTGTSMSREIARLNSKILPTPIFIAELKVGGEIDFGAFGEDYLLITIGGNFLASIVLEISEKKGVIKRSTHDFFETGSIDSFLIRSTKQTVLSFKMDRIFSQPDHALNIKVNRIGNSLFGAPYLEGDLLWVLSLLNRVDFCSGNQATIREHSPKSIAKCLEI